VGWAGISLFHPGAESRFRAVSASEKKGDIAKSYSYVSDYIFYAERQQVQY